MDIKINYYEQQALLKYLKKHLSEDISDIKHLNDFDALYLLTAYNKLQLAIDERNEAMAYTE